MINTLRKQQESMNESAAYLLTAAAVLRPAKYATGIVRKKRKRTLVKQWKKPTTNQKKPNNKMFVCKGLNKNKKNNKNNKMNEWIVCHLPAHGRRGSSSCKVCYGYCRCLWKKKFLQIKKTGWEVGFENAESAAGLQFLPQLGCMARACVRMMFFAQTRTRY